MVLWLYGYMVNLLLVKFICWLIGHRLVNIDIATHIAECVRCERKMRVSYDMSNGETYVVAIIGDKDD